MQYKNISFIMTYLSFLPLIAINLFFESQLSTLPKRAPRLHLRLPWRPNARLRRMSEMEWQHPNSHPPVGSRGLC